MILFSFVVVSGLCAFSIILTLIIFLTLSHRISSLEEQNEILNDSLTFVLEEIGNLKETPEIYDISSAYPEIINYKDAKNINWKDVKFK